MNSGLGRVAPSLVSKVNLVADLAALFSALALAAYFGQSLELGGIQASFLVTAFATWLIVSTSLHHYDPTADRSPLDEAAMVVVLTLAISTLLACVNALSPLATGSLASAGAFLLIFLPVALLLRLSFRPLYAREDPIEEVLIVGSNPLGRLTAEDLEAGPARRRIVGMASFPDEKPPSTSRWSHLGTTDAIAQILADHPIHKVYLAGNPARQGAAMQVVIKTCETFGLPFALPVHSFRLDRARPTHWRALKDGYVHYEGAEPKPSQRAIKRLFDIAASGVALWLLLPLLLVVALLIKVTSKGPIFFRQKRVGLHGRTFPMLKFRTMVANAEALKASLSEKNEQSGPVFKMKNDPRITPVGRILRRHSIDELPQLINVLRGDMSVVGPRPPVPQEVAKYQPWQRRRLSVRPGLTCIWQVSGRNQITFEEWMYLDMRYIDNWSLGEDLGLILRTVPIVLTGRGAS